jgi:hydrogenase maturation protease
MKVLLDPQFIPLFVQAKKVAILGCGSPLRGDDAAGSLVAAGLVGLNDTEGDDGSSDDNDSYVDGGICGGADDGVERRVGSRVRAFVGDVAPENLTGELKQYRPDLLLIIDAMDMGLAPGETRIISLEEIGGMSFSSHILPLPIMMDYLAREVGCNILLLGIQTANHEFLANMTPVVAQTVEALAAELKALLV